MDANSLSPRPSAIATGLASGSAPPSPSLNPPTGYSSAGVTRRRTSWGNKADAGTDSLQFDPPLKSALPIQDPLSSSKLVSGTMGNGGGSRTPSSRPLYIPPDDPFSSPPDEQPPLREFPFSASATRYPSITSTSSSFSTSQPRASSAALIPPDYAVENRGFDDDVRLTAHIGGGVAEQGWDSEQAFAADTERVATGPGLRVRYDENPSPLKKTGTALKNISKNFRRVSLRVVNLASAGLENQIRLPDNDAANLVDSGFDDGGDSFPDLRKLPPIRGRTLGFLGPTNRLRLTLFRFLVHPWTEPAILLLIVLNTVVLVIQAFHSPNATPPPSDGSNDDGVFRLPVKGYFHSWEDYALFVLFIIFTLEAFARICVSGFMFDPEVPVSSFFSAPSPDMSPNPFTPSVASPNTRLQRQHPRTPLSRGSSFRQWLPRIQDHFRRAFALPKTAPSIQLDDSTSPGATLGYPPPRQPISEKSSAFSANHSRNTRVPSVSLPHDKTEPFKKPGSEILSLPFKGSVILAHNKTHRNLPYLRHSWNRIDLIAIVGFWISFGLATGGLERGRDHIGIFRALSVLRTARLLTVTAGTTTIMHSLKYAVPLLTSVAYFVLFAMILFSVIGMQSFKGSLRRSCYLTPGNVSLNRACGGHIDPQTLDVTAYIPLVDGKTVLFSKGYICPMGQICMESDNPNNNIQSFDNIFSSALQIMIIASANGWSQLMYQVIDSEFFISSFFFVACIIVLNFWLINLFVAVITNTFSAIRANTKKSAFGAALNVASLEEEKDDGWSIVDGRPVSRYNWFKAAYEPLRWFFVLLALASVVAQATRTVDSSPTHESILFATELAITVAFDVEIAIRVLAELPKWRAFFDHGNNLLDLVLAVGSSIIQIPAIRRSSVYPWFTIFQLARFYRVILEFPRMRPLLLAVFGNMYGLANMVLFLILTNFLAALFGVQLLRGDIPNTTFVSFGNIYNSFLGVYQVFSSENWTTLLYNAITLGPSFGRTVITAVFIASWLVFANFIILQMFIAVINENFDVAEELKRGKQATDYWATHLNLQENQFSWLRKLNPYRWFKANPIKVKVDHLPSNLVLPIRKALIQDYQAPRVDTILTSDAATRLDRRRGPMHYTSKSLRALQRLFSGDVQSNDVPLNTLRHARADTVVDSEINDEETERYLEIIASTQTEAPSEDVNDAVYEARAQKADFIRDHPTYDNAFWVITQKNPLRRLCQKLVGPAGGERIFGTPHSPIAHTIFQLFLLLAVIGGIVIEGIATPPYRYNFYLKHGPVRFAWFDIAEAVFGLTLFLEFLIKVVADGFLLTPNAYMRSIWNVLDLFILIGLLVNTTTSLIFIGGLNRITRSLKALRALRLITLIEKMRTTFESLLLSGITGILDAAILAILYIIPYAVWGLNIFNGRMLLCNDNSVGGESGCVNEVWKNPSPSTSFSFDSFHASLLILFEIVSLEGWIDVMNVANSITRLGLQPQINASPFNSLFFLTYNLFGGVVILTVFVSIIIGNFSSKLGTALLTQPQREWIDLQKLIRRQKPSKRPRVRPTSPFRAWCYDRAVHKHGWWTKAMTVIFVVHIFALMTQTYPTKDIFDAIRSDFFIVVTFVFIIDTLVRLYGLGWISFRANGWNLFDFIVSSGSFLTTMVVRFGSTHFVIEQLQKLFLVSIAFKLVQRTNSLNKLFKTAVSSLQIIFSLLTLWLILFLFFAILYLEVFSMTRWESAETRNQNYATMSSALLMLAFMSTGEGWNQYMHDYTVVYPRCTHSSTSKNLSDCGSVGWAYSLFIAWNLLSEYIFVNMFTAVVVENFSYVFQSTSAKSITREEMRAFKKVWAEFANPKTEYLEPCRFVPFFAKLSGVFEVRIYPPEYSIPNILAACRVDPAPDPTRSAKLSGGVDLSKLNEILRRIDYEAIRKRRHVYSGLYHEAKISQIPGRGIGFTDMLLLLAHHKLIVDRDALILKDLVVRNETNKLVNNVVCLDKIRSVLRKNSLRRQFLQRKAMLLAEQHDVPAIIVDTDVSTPPGTPPGVTSGRGSVGVFPDLPSTSRTSLGASYVFRDESLSAAGSALQRSRRSSDVSILSADLGYRLSREMTPVEQDAQRVLSSMENSMWGDMMLQAEEETS